MFAQGLFRSLARGAQKGRQRQGGQKPDVQLSMSKEPCSHLSLRRRLRLLTPPAILLASPRKALYFVIFVLALQQLDGNVIGPKILGDSTGLSAFWVIFSITLFGGL